MISGRGFANECRWIVDDRYTDHRYTDILAKTGDWVFLNPGLIDSFLLRVGRKKFVFVLHNADEPFDEVKLIKLLPFSIRIYSINTIVVHPLVRTIPFGVADSAVSVLPSFRSNPVKTIEIYSNFSVYTNRMDCIEAFKDNPSVVRKDPKDRNEYYMDLCRSKFVLCPQGYGIDTQRVYEALWCGAIPVVLHSSLDHLYQTMPVCILTKWTDPFYIPTGSARFSCRDYLC